MAEILRQATAVAIDGRAVLIEGPPGCGKTGLAIQLIDRGGVLIGDDGVALSDRGGVLLASPPSATRGLIEMRNVAIVSLPACAAPVALVLTITDTAPRFIEQAQMIRILGHQIARIDFTLTGVADPVRAEFALRQYGAAPAR
ncbi:HPr kinase/phosphorylase [Pontixanthobacter sp.]|uniref:HPr kinase/phosphorylase n=1 Tax=Pontixanthobacter sp. TaxID=2792078 RepID=UPI003C7A5F6F